MKVHSILLILILIIAAALQAPRLLNEKRFFYDEDEAHHFNRQVEMLKNGELNPKYFLKPSLNFYLRLPAISAGFLWSVKKGELRSIHEVETRDPAGLAGYNFKIPYPKLLKFNQLSTIIMYLVIIAVIFYAVFYLTKNHYAAFTASSLFTIAPLVLEHNLSIGVNIPTAMFCALSILFAVRYYEFSKVSELALSAITAGLACSTKYNALPIVLVPLCLLLKSCNLKTFLIATLLPWVAFILASPYILAELPLFLDHLAYEVWHYSVAGHAGHTATPGLDQFLFYLQTAYSGHGQIAFSLLAVSGIFIAFFGEKKNFGLFVFVAAYLFLMSQQKTNFERNILLISPALCILAGVAYNFIFRSLRGTLTNILLILLVLLQPAFALVSSCSSCHQSKPKRDSRLIAYDYLHQDFRKGYLAIDRNLEMPSFVVNKAGQRVLSRPGTARVNLKQTSLSELFLSGYDYILLGENYKFENSENKYLKIVRQFSGDLSKQRIINSPAMVLYKFDQEKFLKSNSKKILSLENRHCSLKSPADILNQRFYRFNSEECTQINLKIFSPWEQEIRINNLTKSLAAGYSGNISFEQLSPNQEYILSFSVVRKPVDYNISIDTRSIALELK